jgi:transposase
MRKLLATLGCWDEVDHKAFAGRLARNEVKCHDGTPLPPELRERLLRECERLALAAEQLAALEKTRQASVPAAARRRSDDLARLKGIGEVGASRLALELFWRDFSNRRQADACPDLAPVAEVPIAVGMPITGHPPHRSVRAQFGHTAPTLGD